jgi:hypothetical protein
VAVGFLGMLLVLRRIPSAGRALTARGMVSRLEIPHSFRWMRLAFLLTVALGRLPALFAMPAGIGDITTAIVTQLVARRPARGSGRLPVPWLKAFA